MDGAVGDCSGFTRLVGLWLVGQLQLFDQIRLVGLRLQVGLGLGHGLGSRLILGSGVGILDRTATNRRGNCGAFFSCPCLQQRTGLDLKRGCCDNHAQAEKRPDVPAVRRAQEP
eukprot:GAFH01001348.1.p6 GENE.GAFH01001348.1~~GAFH01001348.1.p6  ORF type:complete len:114 (-),score=19.27 GAFH01001348.1:176-517(-)